MQYKNGSKEDSQNNSSSRPSATEVNAGITDPRQKRKNTKHKRREDGGREVTDPVTHLPVIIYDSTDRRLEKAPHNEPAQASITTSIRSEWRPEVRNPNR